LREQNAFLLLCENEKNKFLEAMQELNHRDAKLGEAEHNDSYAFDRIMERR
jgi:hypothetical protein